MNIFDFFNKRKLNRATPIFDTDLKENLPENIVEPIQPEAPVPIQPEEVDEIKKYDGILKDIENFFHMEKIEVLPGRIYVASITKNKVYISLSTQYAEVGIIGIATDIVDEKVNVNNIIPGLPLALSGDILAYVDKEYEPNTSLTSSDHGQLTEESYPYPSRILATYLKPEKEEFYQGLMVNGRHWVKIKNIFDQKVTEIA